MKLEIDWTECYPEVREAIDLPFARSGLMDQVDNAACGWMTVEEDNRDDLADRVEEMSEVFAEAADKIREKTEKTTEGGSNQSD